MKRYIKSTRFSYRTVDPEELEATIADLKERLNNPNLSSTERMEILDTIEMYKASLFDSYDFNRDPYSWEL